MKKSILFICATLFSIMFMTGCASNLFPGGPTPAGVIITNVTAPSQYLAVATDKDAQSIKVGESSATAILGLFAFGDASIDAAMKDGNIRRVHHVDHRVNLILYGLFLKDTTIVHGD
ncbi:MAG: TRL-like family protein [Desulfobacteraceae bacterium]|nr:TRL-like family protein [Desulfobacteraceae bacterium]